ncbi:MAG: hypothetical protein Q7S60_02020 [bacterium]|nr:hypothetical protein [bacterium]
MNQDEFKKLLDEALEPVKETLKRHTVVLVEHAEALETLKASAVTIENTINVYGDMYKINNDNAKKLEKRVETLEEKAGVESPPELTLAEVQ